MNAFLSVVAILGIAYFFTSALLMLGLAYVALVEAKFAQMIQCIFWLCIRLAIVKLLHLGFLAL